MGPSEILKREHKKRRRTQNKNVNILAHKLPGRI